MKLSVSNTNAPVWRDITVKAELPNQLKPLDELAKNLWWVWNSEAKTLFRTLNPDLWRKTGENPVMLLQQLSSERIAEILADEILMAQINHVEEQYGIEISAVEVKKLDLPDDNKQAVYTRMISERENIAAQYTAEGKSEAKMIENTTDKEVSIMLSDAQAKAEATVAEGEAEYMKILTNAYSDPAKMDFYSFVRALDALKESMRGDNKTIILSDDSPIAQIFNGQY